MSASKSKSKSGKKSSASTRHGPRRRFHSFDRTTDAPPPLPEYEPSRDRAPRCPRCDSATMAEPVVSRLYCWCCLMCGWEGAWFRRPGRAVQHAASAISAWEEALGDA